MTKHNPSIRLLIEDPVEKSSAIKNLLQNKTDRENKAYNLQRVRYIFRFAHARNLAFCGDSPRWVKIRKKSSNPT
jgi:hypothetical protein